MITINFETLRNKGLAEGIYDEIRNKILQGELKANQKLPSKRSLAQHLNVSTITVQNSYDRLIGEGYVFSIEKKGYFVTDLEKELNLSNKSRSQGKKIISSSNEKISDEWFADFYNNSSWTKKFPFRLWAHTLRQVLNTEDQSLLSRPAAKGTLELRKQIAFYLEEFKNMKVNPEQIIIGAGTETLCQILTALLGRDKIYAVENPGYKKISRLFELNGAKSIPIKIDDEGLKISLLEKSNAEIVHLTPSHHFPTGKVMSIKRRISILNWASLKKEHYILEDDYDSEFRFNSKPIASLYAMDKNSKVIYMNTFSKTLSPSIRISYMILPPQLLEKFEKNFSFYSCQVSVFEQYTLAKFIEEGLYSKHIIKMKNYYRSIRNELITCLNKSRISSVCKIHEEEAGLHFLLEIQKNPLDSEKILAKLSKEKIRIPLLTDYYYTNERKKLPLTFIINYSGLKKELIAETVARLEKAILGE